MMRVRWLTLIMLSLIVMDGCAHPTHTPRSSSMILDAEVLHSGLYCGGDLGHPTVRWITSPAGLNRLQQQLPMQGSPNLELSKVDFSREGILLIAMGQRPTGGYRLTLGPQPVRVEADTLIIPVSWTEPAPGFAQIQVITSPCLLLKLPAISFQRIRVVDQHGQARVETPIE